MFDSLVVVVDIHHFIAKIQHSDPVVNPLKVENPGIDQGFYKLQQLND